MVGLGDLNEPSGVRVITGGEKIKIRVDGIVWAAAASSVALDSVAVVVF